MKLKKQIIVLMIAVLLIIVIVFMSLKSNNKDTQLQNYYSFEYNVIKTEFNEEYSKIQKKINVNNEKITMEIITDVKEGNIVIKVFKPSGELYEERTIENKLDEWELNLEPIKGDWIFEMEINEDTESYIKVNCYK